MKKNGERVSGERVIYDLFLRRKVELASVTSDDDVDGDVRCLSSE